MIKRMVLMMACLTLEASAGNAATYANTWQKGDGVLYSSVLSENADPGMISIILPGTRWASMVISFFGSPPCPQAHSTAEIWVESELETLGVKCETFGKVVIFSYTLADPLKVNALYQSLRAGHTLLIDRRFLISPGNLRHLQ